MSPTTKTLIVVFGGMIVTAVTVVGGVMIALALPIDHGNYMFLLHIFYGAIIGLVVGMTIWFWLVFMVCRDKNTAPPKRHRQIKYLLLATSLAVLFVGFISYNFNWGFSIYRAAELGKIEAVKQYLDSGGDVNVKSNSGMTPLHHAAYRENKEVIELLIAKGASLNAKDVAGRTPLNVAIRYNRTEAAALLRIHGGKTSDWLNADDSIHNAASAGHIEAVKKHLSNGVNVNSQTKKSFTPLDIAIRRKHPETADLLRTHGGKSGAEYSIHVAAELGDIEAVKEHLNAGIDVDARDQADKTPLPHAAYWGHKEIVELLISKGANVNARDKRGSTPLNWANENRQTEIADLIRNHGGKIFKSFSALDNKENRRPPPQTRWQDG